MGNLGGGEMLVILLVAVIVLGPTKLPPAVRQVGKFVGEIRRIGQGFQQELREAAQPLAETTETIKAADPRKVIEPPPEDKDTAKANDENSEISGKGTVASGPKSWGTAAASLTAPGATSGEDTDAAPRIADGPDTQGSVDGPDAQGSADTSGAAEPDPESQTDDTAPS